MSETFRNLTRLSSQGKIYLDIKLKKYGLNSGQFPYILFICDSEGITQEKINSIICVHASNVTRALDALCKKGYITKEDLESDRRTCRLYPTDKARRIYGELRQLESEWIDIITGGFTEKEKTTLHDLLKKCDANLVAYLAVKKENQEGWF
ncbi:MAG: MarR family transcriptional regulator [Clostridiales bacterium]|nr:MarR family transcriptional regulator [Clostridiales bacterium]